MTDHSNTQTKTTTFYLASSSPQRIRLLSQEGYSFEVISHGVEEPEPLGGPREYALLSARLKALGGAAKVKEGLVVGADTIVAYRGKILGKPESLEDGIAMIRELQGTSHLVLTGICLVEGPDKILAEEVAESRVEMDPLSDDQIRAYLGTVDHLEKAGACDIENITFARVVEGSYANVVGFPIECFGELYQTWIQRS